MYHDEHKILGRFCILALPRFSSSLDVNAYEFLIFYEEILHNLALIMTRVMDYNICQWVYDARYWWSGYMDSRQVILLPYHGLSSLRCSW